MKEEKAKKTTRRKKPASKTGVSGKGADKAPGEQAGAEPRPAPRSGAGKEYDPRIIAFVCKWCSGTDAEAEGPGRKETGGGTAVRVVDVMCSGRVQPSLVLKAFELGADGVVICGCRPGKCHYYFGNERQAEMFETSKKLVALLGLGEERLRLEWVSGAEGDGLVKVLKDFTDRVRAAGPSPLNETRRVR